MSSRYQSLLNPLSTHPAWIIFFSALVLRVILVLSVGHLIPEASDKLDRYDPIAFSLMRGEGFSLNGAPTAISGPVYPLLLSVLYTLFGYSTTVVRLFVSVLDAGHAVIFYWITKRAFGGPVPALAALALIISPFTIYCILALAPEIPFLVFHALFILYFVSALDTGRSRDFLISGMALGVATLSRAVPLLLPFAVLPVFIINAKRRRQGLLNFAVFLLGSGHGLVEITFPCTGSFPCKPWEEHTCTERPQS
jgi:4-amino-4-deoxy-L-arabinose transferase-like glycosyltransferase